MANMGYGSLRALVHPRDCRSKRISSWDRTGRNLDFLTIRKGETVPIAEIEGAGCINHIWITVATTDLLYLRKVLIKMYWDGEKNPSVLTPLGDFFGVGHAKASHFVSLPLSMVTGGDALRNNRAAMNCFFPMPFAESARIEVTNDCDADVGAFYYYVDYELLSESQGSSQDTPLRFHAWWNRENPTEGVDLSGKDFGKVLKMSNRSGDGNYAVLDAVGRGHYVGCNLSIDHINPIPSFTWFGEGDDMIFIDGEKWPPSLHGTGTEDYFCAAWGYPSGEYSGPYHGISYAEPLGEEQPLFRYSGKWTTYRFHIEDPICFNKSIRVTIEHGHANCHSNDYSSVAYWYQTEPHKRFRKILPVKKRLPIETRESFKLYSSTI